MAGIYVLLDFHPYLQDPTFVRTIKDIALEYNKCARTVVLISHEVKLPDELDHLAVRVTVKLPDKNERHLIVMRIAREWAQTHGAMPDIDLEGRREAGRQPRRPHVARLRTADTHRHLQRRRVDRRRHHSAARGQVPVAEPRRHVSFEPDTAKFAEVGGLKNLRRWILQRKAAFDGSAPGSTLPRAFCCWVCRVAARAWPRAPRPACWVCRWCASISVRCIRSGTANRKRICASHSPLPRRSRRVCCGSTKSKRRCLPETTTAARRNGYWEPSSRGSSEQRAKVFIVATANDITALPPELVRKGRFDEIFFVDLPTPAARLEILGIHCKKRGIAISEGDMKVLAARGEGFSGAELEQAVVSALYTAHSNKQAVNARLIAGEFDATKPLSVVLGEKIAELRDWARERTVPAD